ncbi:Uncharacterised protein (plasmid) [Tsukamurella tyrosinosolvens]|uniref:Uncharacterized protein n=1 Tax=Tsukamurella tyrosinosolvens TaxID=57704 RepID=A0A1H4UWI8_TSUTY|nr:hypothetical protein [Tsukamurella tyrosinosolvens]SEC73117.1 hypothetical protein SAMN04489793_3063 [Tsukamurella tyrosinosolvens]VEH90835.1 Uncharacterised protein [Tsukamurella tyrosinosolvens]
MPIFSYVVDVDAASQAEADTVIAERLDHEEDYGFPYTLQHTRYTEAASGTYTGY